jgi:sporulation protein YlmC with PRC-barrel domain
MKLASAVVVSFALAVMPAAPAMAQIAGSIKLGTSVEELRAVAEGWSAKRQILGQTVYNQNKEKVGKIDDLIVAPDGELAFAIIGAGGFAGLGRHDVAIPIEQLQLENGKFILEGATRASIKSQTKFSDAKST